MNLDSLSVLASIRVDGRDIVQRAGHSTPVDHFANQLERLFVNCQSSLTVSQLFASPRDIVQVDGNVPLVVQRLVDLERRDIRVESLLVFAESGVGVRNVCSV